MTTLGDYISIRHGFAFKGDGITNEDNGVVLVTPGNFAIGGGFKEGKCKFFKGDYPVEYVLSPGDLIVTMTDLSKDMDTLGYSALVPSSHRIYLHNQRIGLVCIKDEGVDKHYLYWFMRTQKYQRTIAGNSSGTTVHHTSPSRICEVEVNFPRIDIQQKIARTLDSLEEKIRKNEEINENLAQQTQGILYHFMDKFPFHFKPLSDIAFVIDCLHSKKPSIQENSPYQLIQLDNIRDDGFLDLSACKYMISSSDYENWTRKCEIVEGDCVITNVGRIGAVSQAPLGTRAAMGRNMTCIRLKHNVDLKAFFITVLLSKHMKIQIMSNTDEGTIMGALNVKNIPKLLFPIFDSPTMARLESILYPLRKKIEYNNLQNQTLTLLRDSLLPKLMSGELDVSNLDL